MAQLEPYHFTMMSMAEGGREIDVLCDPNEPLMDIWTHVARKEGIQLSIDGEEIIWSFSWSGEVDEQLPGHKSLNESGVPADAEIMVRGETLVGAVGTRGLIWRVHRRKLKEFVERHKAYASIHNPKPESMVIRFHNVRAIIGLDSEGNPIWRDEHEAQLTGNPYEYPDYPPTLKPLSPVFHPNVSPESYCLFTAFPLESPDPLSLMVSQAVEILQYRAYNLNEPHNRMNPEASEWVESGRHEKFLPIVPFVRLI